MQSNMIVEIARGAENSAGVCLFENVLDELGCRGLSVASGDRDGYALGLFDLMSFPDRSSEVGHPFVRIADRYEGFGVGVGRSPVFGHQKDVGSSLASLVDEIMAITFSFQSNEKLPRADGPTVIGHPRRTEVTSSEQLPAAGLSDSVS